MLVTLGLIPAAHAQMEEVVVTATRRDESQQTVPISITALSSETLAAARVEGVKDLGFVTPGLNMNGRSNVWIPYIRGIGAQDTSGGQEASVSIYIDGVYMSSPHAGALSFNNVERVEVLKGPQGTLFGRNSTGGLINVITRDPGQELEVFGKLGIGDYETYTAQLYVGGGITDTLSADIALNYMDQGEAYGRNVFSGREIATDGDEGARTKWIWEPGDSTKLTWTADYQKARDGSGRQPRADARVPGLRWHGASGRVPGRQHEFPERWRNRWLRQELRDHAQGATLVRLGRLRQHQRLPGNQAVQ